MRKHPNPALFGILILPFGASVGFLQVADALMAICSRDEDKGRAFAMAIGPMTPSTYA
jgi:hypothetical protein